MSSSDRLAIFILEGSTAYDSIKAFNFEVAKVLRAANLDVITLDIDNPHSFNHVLRQSLDAYPNRIAAALSFSGFAVEAGNSDGGNLWQRLKIPILSWMLDHPCYYLARHNTPAAAVMRLYPNHDFLNFHREHIRSPYRTGFVRFGAMSYGRQPYRREIKPGATPMILLPKSGNDPAKIETTWKLLPHKMQRVIHDAIDHYWGQTRRSGPVSPSVLAAADGNSIELRNDISLFTFFITQLDDYIRRLKVDILLKQLLPLPVTMYGSGIDYIDTGKARAKILPPIDYAQLVDKFFEASAVISMNPNIDDECHDRPYSAFGAGAMPISDINPWWEKKFPKLAPYSYDFRNRSVAEPVEKFLADPQTASDIAWEHSQAVCKERSFETFVHETLEFAVMHRYFTFNFEPPQNYFTKWGD